MRLPARLYGWGFRSLEETCGPAYLATLKTALPSMAGPGELRPQLADLWGGPECWGEGASKEDRWRQVLASGSRAGQEMIRVWDGLQQEKQQVFRWLGGEEPKVLACGVEGIGDGSVSGETRRRLTEARENWRAKVLTKKLRRCGLRQQGRPGPGGRGIGCPRHGCWHCLELIQACLVLSLQKGLQATCAFPHQHARAGWGRRSRGGL